MVVIQSKKQITTQKSKILITTADYDKCTKDIAKSIKRIELVDKSDIDLIKLQAFVLLFFKIEVILKMMVLKII